MRVQKLDNNIFIKSLDPIDSYLINIISRYFNSDGNYLRINTENIINEAVRRVKEDLDGLVRISILDNSVTSINNMHGDIILDYLNTGAEKAFNKRTAFNKDFGTENGTVCMGNDTRLSDARVPLEHNHDEYVTASAIDIAILSLLSKNGINVNGTDIVISNKNLKIVNGELVENNG